jgi:hypothetical protein
MRITHQPDTHAPCPSPSQCTSVARLVFRNNPLDLCSTFSFKAPPPSQAGGEGNAIVSVTDAASPQDKHRTQEACRPGRNEPLGNQPCAACIAGTGSIELLLARCHQGKKNCGIRFKLLASACSYPTRTHLHVAIFGSIACSKD